jgi:competence protein ComEC
MTLLYLGLSWLAGIALADWLKPPLIVAGILATPALAALLLWRREPRPRRIAACALALLAGGGRVAVASHQLGPGDLATYNDLGAPITVVGIVDTDPEVRATYQEVRLRAESLTLTAQPTMSQTIPIAGRLLVMVPGYPAHAYGERLCVTGQLTNPPDETDFSYREYLARQDIHSQMLFPHINLMEAGQGSVLWNTLYGIRRRALATISLILPEPHAGLLGAILLGVDTGIPKVLYDQFNTTGTSHVAVISGSNIAIICAFLMAAGTRVVGRRWAFRLSVIGVAAYTLLVGAEPPVVRAAIMGGLYVLARYFGRQAEARTSLVFAAMLMTALNPGWLSDRGFQLSVAATAGLIWLVPPLEQAAGRWLGSPSGPIGALRGLLGDGLVVTLAAQLTTLPVILYHFQRLSATGLLANVLIVPVQPLVMFTGGAATLAGMLWLPAGQLLGWLAWLPLAWTLLVVEHMASLPFASWSLDQFGSWPIMLSSVAVLAIAYLATRRGMSLELPPTAAAIVRLRPLTGLMLTGGVMVVLAVWFAVASVPDGRLHVTFLDVGQGDAILITTPRGGQILVDGGPDPTQLLWALGRHMPFWDRSLDVVINTHPEADHLAGLPSVLERYEVARVMLPDVQGRSTLYAAWQAILAQEGVPVIHGRTGMRVRTEDGVQMDVLHPDDLPDDEHLNNHSLVLRVTMGETAFLLTGDIESGVEQELVARHFQLGATVLKVPHHGSSTSSSPALLRAVGPQVAVISVGAGNQLGLPAAEVVQRYVEHGIRLLRTDQVGSVEFITDGDYLQVTTDGRPATSGGTTPIASTPLLR